MSRIPRRDRCYFVGLRAQRLYHNQAAAAWMHLGKSLESLGDKDLPKYNDLITAIRNATFYGKHRIAFPLSDCLYCDGRISETKNTNKKVK